MSGGFFTTIWQNGCTDLTWYVECTYSVSSNYFSRTDSRGTKNKLDIPAIQEVRLINISILHYTFYYRNDKDRHEFGTGFLPIPSWGVQCRTSNLSVPRVLGCVSEVTPQTPVLSVRMLHIRRGTMKKKQTERTAWERVWQVAIRVIAGLSSAISIHRLR